MFTDENIRLYFGHETAEDEEIDRLKSYYVKGDSYDSVAGEIPLYLLVGHKGTGKSALLNVLEAEKEQSGNVCVTVRPDDISGVLLDTDDFLQLIREWKKGLSNIIFRKLMLSLSEKTENKWAKRVIKLAMSFFHKTITDWGEENIRERDFSAFMTNELFSEKKVFIIIDDLDRGWKNTPQDISRVSALINAVRDLSRDLKNLRFRIALRSDVYYAVRTSDESTDKIESSVIWNRWTNHEILVMLIKRIETARGNEVDENELLKTKQSELQLYLTPLFEERFKGRGHWNNAPMYQVLMSLIRKRPRDLIKLCTMSAKKARENKHDKIMTEDLESIFVEYSTGRMQDTVNEYSSEFPQIEDLLLKMKPSKREIQDGISCLFKRDQLISKLKEIKGRSNYRFADSRKSVSETNLAAFLYKINFLTARLDLPDSTIQRVYYDENKYLINEFSDYGYKYEIHPAYRWALQQNDIGRLYDIIELSEE